MISAQLQPWDGPQPYAIITWNCSVYDQAATISGFGTVLESRRIDALGYKVKSRTDGGGRTLETYDQENFKSTAQYDANSNVLQSRDPNNVGFDADYDNLNRQTSQTDTFGDTTGSAFDTESNLVKSTDAKGNFTQFAFDALNRRKTVTDRLNGVTTFGYTPTSQLSALTDAENQSTLYDYNDRGEKTKETYPDHVPGSTPGTAGYGIVEFAYDPAGRTRLKTDQMGDTCTFNHDLAGRMLQRDYRTFANSPSGTIADSDTFTFDRASRMLTGNSGRYNNQVGMGYDFGGRLSSESLTIAGQTYTTARAYDTRGLEASMTYPNGSLVERTYSPRQQLHQTKYLGTVVDARTYDNGGRHASSTYANGAVTTNAYRLDNLLSSRVTTHAGTEQIGTYFYTWDANKNKTGEAITGTMSGYGFTVPTSGGYDAEDRVTSWNRTDGNKNQSWNLSLVGDWNTHVDAGVTQTRTHGPAHEFTSVTIGGNNHALSYDPKGNMLTRPAALSAPALNLVWDFENQLKGADIDGTPASLEVTFEFDALGRRVARNEGSSQIILIQAGQQTIADYARTSPSSSPTYRYVYASYIDEPILRHAGTLGTLPTTGTDAIYYHRNQQYSIVGLTDAAGGLIEGYAYSAYGIVSNFDALGTSISASAFNNRFTYTGREWENIFALCFFRTRYFEPAIGRFLGRDSSGYLDGNNLYENYFLLSATDFSGRYRFPCTCDCFISGPCWGGYSCWSEKSYVEASTFASAQLECENVCKLEEVSVSVATSACNAKLVGDGAENAGVLCFYLAGLCDKYSEPKRTRCQNEALELCKCIAMGYGEVMRRGGPVRTKVDENSLVCTKCTEIIQTSCELVGSKFFYPSERAAKFGPRRPHDYVLARLGCGYGHAWNSWVFEGPDHNEYVTIDVWSNPERWWGPGLDSCGHCDNVNGPPDLPRLPK